MLYLSKNYSLFIIFYFINISNKVNCRINIPPNNGSCYDKNRDNMDSCYHSSISNWDYYNKIAIDSNNDTLLRALCCLMWETYDCQLFIAQNHCDKSEFEDFYELWMTATEYWTRNEIFCDLDFPYGTPKCYFPFWIIAVIITVCVIILSIEGFLILRYYRRKIYL